MSAATLADVNPIVYSHLDAIKRLFKGGYKATLVLRNPRRGVEASLVISDDPDEAKVIDTIRRFNGAF